MALRLTSRRGKDGPKVRITEIAYEDTWPDLRRELDRVHVDTVTGAAPTFRQRTEITKAQRDILDVLTIDTPAPDYQLTPAGEY